MRTTERFILKKKEVEELGIKKFKCRHQLKNIAERPIIKWISNIKIRS